MKNKMTTKGRYIVYPDGALDWDEIKETVELLEFEGKNPKIVKYNGLWNVEAEVSKKMEIETVRCIECNTLFDFTLLKESSDYNSGKCPRCGGHLKTEEVSE